MPLGNGGSGLLTDCRQMLASQTNRPMAICIARFSAGPHSASNEQKRCKSRLIGNRILRKIEYTSCAPARLAVTLSVGCLLLFLFHLFAASGFGSGNDLLLLRLRNHVVVVHLE